MITRIPFEVLVELMKLLEPTERNTLRTTCRLLREAATVVDCDWLETVANVERFWVLEHGDDSHGIMENLVSGLVPAPDTAIPMLERTAIQLRKVSARQFRDRKWRFFRAHAIFTFLSF
jgi:hypothetical protein